MAAVMILKPRPYQAEAIDACLSAWERGLQRIAVVHATGLGKTVVMSHVANRRRAVGRIGIIIHLDTLVTQTADAVHSVAPDLSIGVVKADRNNFDADVVIMSIQTLARANRLQQIPPDHFATIIVDETHHAGADSYVTALHYFGCYRPGGAVLVGFTATLVRMDKRGLGDIFQEVVDRRDILWGIRHGYLVDLKPFITDIAELNFDDVSRAGGDFRPGSLAKQMMKVHAPGVMAQTIADQAPDRQGVAFWPTVAVAHQFARECELRGISCVVVSASTPDDERVLIKKRIRAGEIQVMSNVGIATEGYDMPQWSFVADGSPSMNVGLLTQKIGRGLRPWSAHDTTSEYPWLRKSKTDCLIFLMAGTTSIRLASLVDLSTTTIREIKPGETLTEAIDREEAEDSTAAGRVRAVQLTATDLFSRSSEDWLQTNRKQYWFLSTKPCAVALLPDDTTAETFSVWKVYGTAPGPRRKNEQVWSGMTFEYGMAMAESLAEELDPAGTYRSKDASWKKRKNAPPTTAQLDTCKRCHIPVPDGSTKVEVSHLLSKFFSSGPIDRYTPPPPKED